MKKVLCPECGKLTMPEITEAEREVEIRGEKIKVISEMPKCKNCGNEFIMKAEGRDSYTLAYDVYRKRHNLLKPEEIKAIREKYGISSKPFAKLLGWGELTVYKYERGGLQDDAHDEVLKIIEDPENMKILYESKLKGNLDETEQANFLSKLDELLKKVNPYERAVRNAFGYKPSINSGNRPFDLNKTMNLIIKIICGSVKKELYEVQLVKCLFFCDFLFFKKHGISMTGLNYVHGPYGPMVNDYQKLFCYAVADKKVTMEVIPLEIGEGHLYKTGIKPDETLFSGEEAVLINEVCKKLTPFSSKKLSEKTHKEVSGWKNTINGQSMTYEFARELKDI